MQKTIFTLLFIFFLQIFINSFAKAESCPQMRDINEHESVETLQGDIEALEQQLAEKKKKLAIAQEIQIKDCDNITVQTEEDREILDELQKLCKQDPDNFWVQLDVDGNITFLLKYTSGNNNVFTFSSNNDVTFKYKNHSLIVKGGYDYTQVGTNDSEGFKQTQEIAASTEYNLQIKKSNFSAFAKIAYDATLGKSQEGTNNLHTTTGTVGVKYGIIQNDTTSLTASLGIGATAKQFTGSLADQPNGLNPVLSADLILKHEFVPDVLSGQAGVGLLQDLTGPANTQVTWNAGLDAKIWGGVSLGTSYQGAYDQTQAQAGNAALNHTVLGTLGFSLDPKSWKSKKKREREKKARERLDRHYANHP